jgi:hypothetical protein
VPSERRPFDNLMPAGLKRVARVKLLDHQGQQPREHERNGPEEVQVDEHVSTHQSHL